MGAVLLTPHPLLQGVDWKVDTETSLLRTGQRTPVLDKAVNYLAANFNNSVGLICESSDTSELSNTYWVYSDNYLAALVLNTYGSSNGSLISMADTVTESMGKYLIGQPEPLTHYMVLNKSVFAFNLTKSYLLTSFGSAIINVDVANQTDMYHADEYVDIMFLESIYFHRVHNDSYAQDLFRNGSARWDGTGFDDKATDGDYQTYKLALYVLTAKILGEPVINESSIISTLLHLQDKHSGGFKTSYNNRLEPTSGTNTETTSLVILALQQPILNRNLTATEIKSGNSSSESSMTITNTSRTGVTDQTDVASQNFAGLVNDSPFFDRWIDSALIIIVIFFAIVLLSLRKQGGSRTA
jgi:hypothetical protein